MAALTAYIRKGGSDNNGGSSSGTSADRTGTDGVANGTTTFTSATASFSAGDVDKIINIVTKGRYRIATVTNSTTVTLSGSPSAGSSLTWNIGGAVATIGAILANATAAVVGGDSVYIGAGVYRETVTMGLTPASELQIIGDVDGVKTGDVGEVQWTAYTTNDKTAPSASVLLSLNGKDFLTFKNVVFVGGNNDIINAPAHSNDIKITDCAFITGYHGNSGNALDATATYNTALNWTVDRCVFLKGAQPAINITLTTGASPGTDFDANFQIQNCSFIGSGTVVQVNSSGTSAGEGGGVDMRNCQCIAVSSVIFTNGTRISLNIPCTVDNCFIYGGNTALVAGESGALTEDYNIILGSATPRTNVTAGAHSISDGSYAPLIYFGQERIIGLALRHIGMPAGASSPLLGYGNDGTQTATDLLNRIRPAGGASTSPAVGALEFHNSALKETSTVRTGSNAIKITGPGDYEFVVPVDAVSTTITVYGRFDGTYSGTKPQMSVLSGTECGVSDATATMTGSADTWEQLSLTFTPTAKGVVTIRLISNSGAASGVAYFDDFAVTGSVTPNGFDYYRRAEPYPAQTAAGGGGSPLVAPRLVMA